MQIRRGSICGFPELAWEKAPPKSEEIAVSTAMAHPALLRTTLSGLYGRDIGTLTVRRLNVRHLATGGAKRVYLTTAITHDGGSYPFVLKQFLPIRLTHLPPGATLGGVTAPVTALDALLLERIVWAARRVDALAPGLCPRFGGLWEWKSEQGQTLRVMTEAYVEGQSLERWKGILEDRLAMGKLHFAQYTAERTALERQAITAYVRLWDVLGRQTFTSDPSPWNVLFTPTPSGTRPSIIDLHGIHDGGTPLYVFQTLGEQFGSRDEMLQEVLCPGIVGALGEGDAIRFLRSVRLGLEEQAELRHRTGLTSYAAGSQAITRFLGSLQP